MTARHTWLRLAVTVLLLWLGGPRLATTGEPSEGIGIQAPGIPAASNRSEARRHARPPGPDRDGNGDGGDDDDDAWLGEPAREPAAARCVAAWPTPRSCSGSAQRRSASARGPPVSTDIA